MALLRRLYHYLSQPAADPAADMLYRAAIAQARRVEFYRDLAVPDTIDGRFDMLLLHVVLVMRRLQDRPEVRQALFDLMFADMDRNLREMGVGDMSIGKKIRPMISAFYGRAQAYEKALHESDDVLKATLGRNLYAGKPVEAEILRRVTAQVRKTVAALDAQPIEGLAEGLIEFPVPAV